MSNVFDQFDAPSGNVFDQFDTPKTSQKSQETDWLRQISLAGRAAAEGVHGALTAPHDLGIGLQNLMRKGVNKVFGTHLEMQPTAAQEFSQALTDSGAYEPQTTGEQFASAGIRGATGALTGGGLLGTAGTTGNVIRTGISGTTGGLSAEAARQANLPWWAQIGAGIAGGMAPSVVEGTARVAANAIRPLTRSGQQQIAGSIMATQATNPQQAAQNLQNAQEIVPGSPRNVGEASQDVGLLRLEKGLRSANPTPFGQRISEQNAAQQAELNALGGTPADITRAEAARTATTTPMRDVALNAGQGVVPAPTQAVHNTIDQILQSPVGARETVQKAMGWVRNAIGDESDPTRLYEIRKDINDAIAGRYTPSSAEAPNASTLALARGQLTQVKSALDDTIESVAPGFKAYLQRYADMSKPIDQMKVIQEIKNRAELSSADITRGVNFLGNARFGSALDSALEQNPGLLTPDQVQRLKAIRTDMQYGQAINSPLVKAPGSDTFQNLSIAQVLGAGTTDVHPFFRVLTNPLKWVYKAAGSDQRINQALTDAMLDPKLGAAMLQRATPATVQKFSERLAMFFAPYVAGTAASTRAQIPPQITPQNNSPGIQ